MILGTATRGARALALVGVRHNMAQRTLRIGEKVGVGLRYRLPKTSVKVGVVKEESQTDEQIAEHLRFWKGTCQKLEMYTDAELLEYRAMFRQHATLDKIPLTGFQRFVKSKCKAVGVPSELMPTLSVELWSLFDEDAGNFIDFGEFVSHYPRMVKQLVRYMVRDQGVKTFFDKFQIDDHITVESIKNIVNTYDLAPFAVKDMAALLKEIAPGNPEAAQARDVDLWACDYTSLTTPSLNTPDF